MPYLNVDLVRKRMKELKISEKMLADEADVVPETIKRALMGSVVHNNTYEAICRALEIGSAFKAFIQEQIQDKYNTLEKQLREEYNSKKKNLDYLVETRTNRIINERKEEARRMALERNPGRVIEP